MKSLLKIIKWTVIVIVALVLVFLLTLPFTITPIVNGVAAAGGAVTGTKISVGKVGLNPFSGNLTVKQVKIGNPEGYSSNDLFAVESLVVDLKMSSLNSDTIVIDNIEIQDPLIRYETQKGKSNFDTVMDKLNQGKEAEPAEKKETAEKKADGQKAEPGKKVVIKRFHLAGAKVVAASGLLNGKGITLPVPELTLTGIGEKSGGVTTLEALNEIIQGTGKQSIQAVQGSVTEVADSISKEAQSAAKEIEGSVKEAKEAAKDLKGSVKEVEAAAKDLKNLFKGKKKDSSQSPKEEKGKGLLNALEGLGK